MLWCVEKEREQEEDCWVVQYLTLCGWGNSAFETRRSTPSCVAQSQWTSREKMVHLTRSSPCAPCVLPLSSLGFSFSNHLLCIRHLLGSSASWLLGYLEPSDPENEEVWPPQVCLLLLSFPATAADLTVGLQLGLDSLASCFHLSDCRVFVDPAGPRLAPQ